MVIPGLSVTKNDKLLIKWRFHPKSSDILDSKPNSIRNIRILPSSDLTYSSPKKPRVTQDVPNHVTSSASPHKLNSPVIEKGDDPPTVSSHSGKSFHDTRPKAYIEGHYFNMNGPLPQFWGASNSNWMRSQRMDPTQGSHRSIQGSL